METLFVFFVEIRDMLAMVIKSTLKSFLQIRTVELFQQAIRPDFLFYDHPARKRTADESLHFLNYCSLASRKDVIEVIVSRR